MTCDFARRNFGVGEVSRSSAPYLVDTSTMVFHWGTLTANAPAFVSLTAAAIPRENSQRSPYNHPAG